MKYKFDYKISAFELWQLSMHGIYGSMVGVTNIIFTVAMLLLGVRFWNSVNSFLRVLILIGISLFTVIQPTIVYLRSKKQLEAIPKDMEIGFDNSGIHVITLNEKEDIKWSSVKGVVKKSNMIIILTTAKHGFIITDKMLGCQKEEFYHFLNSKIKIG